MVEGYTRAQHAMAAPTVEVWMARASSPVLTGV